MSKKNSKTNGDNKMVAVEIVQPQKPCPRPGCQNFRAISKSGRLSGLCKQHNVEASKKSRAKNHPTEATKRRDLIVQLMDATTKLPKDKASDTVRELIEKLAGLRE